MQNPTIAHLNGLQPVTTDREPPPEVASPPTKDDRGSPAVERFISHTVTTVMALIAMLTFAFSFGNVWHLAIMLGVPGWIAPLVGPAVDLSVVGLLLGIQYVAEPLAHGEYGIAPLLLIGWSEVRPGLLRQIYTARSDSRPGLRESDSPARLHAFRPGPTH